MFRARVLSVYRVAVWQSALLRELVVALVVHHGAWVKAGIPWDRHRHEHQAATLWMRLSCNFVNVYTIAYRVQYTCTRAHP